MKMMIASALCVLAVITTGCGKRARVEVNLKGMADGPVYVYYAPVTDLTDYKADTLQAVNGKLSFDLEFDSVPMEIRIEPKADLFVDRRGRETVPMSHRIRFWKQAGEKVRVKGKYEEGVLSYALKGSKDLEAQSTLREGVKEALKTYSALAKHVDSLYALGVENLDETYMDSLFATLSSKMEEVATAQQDFVRSHTDKLLSGLYLLEQSSADAFLELEQLLTSEVREGLLKARLDEGKTYYERRKQMEYNAAVLVQDALAPDFTLTDINGKDVKLSDYAGKHVVLDFWGTWCPWCIKGLPEMKKYYNQYKSKVVFIGIACHDKLEKVQSLVKTEKLPWVSVMNGEEDRDVAFMYGVSGYPTKVILKPGLKVEKVVMGEDLVFYETLDRLLK